MLNILVTGGAGYIGSHTVLELLSRNDNVIIVDNFSNSSKKAILNIEKITKSKVQLHEIDLLDYVALEKIFKNNKIDAVIHFAGYKAVGESVENPIKYYDNNLVGIINLLKAMDKYNVNKLIFSSSATVYGSNENMPLTEREVIGSVTNPYANTKVIIEEILGDLCKSNSKWKVVALRYFNPLGAHESGEIGENPNGIPNNLAPYITQVAVGKLEYLTVFGDDYPTPDGTCIRDYVHVMDLAEGHAAALDYINNNDCSYEAINLGSGTGYSVFQIIDNFEKVIGEKIKYIIGPRRKGDLPISYADISKAKSLLKWVPKRSIEEMCRDSWNWQKKNPNGYEQNF